MERFGAASCLYMCVYILNYSKSITPLFSPLVKAARNAYRH